MSYPEYIIRRAIELKEGRSASYVLDILRKEFPKEDLTSLNERTILRWKKTKSEAFVEPSVYIEKEQGAIPSSFLENWKEHNRQLADVAKSLLANDLNSVMRGWTTKRIAGQDTYILTRKNTVGDYYDLTKEQLSKRLKENIVLVEHEYERWFFHDCFLPHLKTELPVALKSEGFFDIVSEQPYQLIYILNVLAKSNTFKGTCPVCKDWF